MTTRRSTVLGVMARWGVTRRVALEINHLLNLHPRLSVTSGYRTPVHNRQVGGSPTSWHLKRRAVDLVGPVAVLRAAEAHAHATGAVEVLVESDHLHVAW